MFDMFSYMAGVLVTLWACQLWHVYVYHWARRTQQRERQMLDRLFPPRLPTPPRRPGSR